MSDGSASRSLVPVADGGGLCASRNVATPSRATEEKEHFGELRRFWERGHRLPAVPGFPLENISASAALGGRHRSQSGSASCQAHAEHLLRENAPLDADICTRRGLEAAAPNDGQGGAAGGHTRRWTRSGASGAACRRWSRLSGPGGESNIPDAPVGEGRGERETIVQERTQERTHAQAQAPWETGRAAGPGLQAPGRAPAGDHPEMDQGCEEIEKEVD